MIEVVLVDKKGNKLGNLERLRAHQNPGKLHKAISVVLYRQSKRGVEVLLQKRARTKFLWPDYWANTVCTHPLPKESNLTCAVRRLEEEMGIVVKKKDLKELYTFYYQADYANGLSEHELDTVMVGKYAGEYKLNLKEVAEARWVEWKKLKNELKQRPDIFAPWPKNIFISEEIIKLFKS